MTAVRSGAIALVLLATPALAAAQTRTDTAEFHLPEVEVSVTRTPRPLLRTPAAVTVLRKAEIQRARPGLSLDEALAAVPGVNINNRFDVSQGVRLSVRGSGARAAFGVRGVRIIADGIPLTMADGQAALNNIDPGSAGRIEVIRGPASALYGNASGGVISIETEEPSAFMAEASGFAGDYGRGSADVFNLRKAQVKVGDRLARGSYLVSGTRTSLNGYRDYSRSTQSMINAKLRYATSARSYVAFTLNAVDQPRAESPGAIPLDSALQHPQMAWPRNVATGSGKVTTQAQAGLRFVRDAHPVRLDASVYGLGRKLDNPLTFGVIHLDRASYGTRAALTRDWRALTLTAGADAEVLRDDRTERNNVRGAPGDTLRKDQLDAVTTAAPFAQVNIVLAQRADVTAGVRYDRVSFRTTDHQLSDGDNSGARTMSAVSPSAGISVRLSNDTRVYGNIATSFQTPTTTELINAPPAPGQPCCQGGFNTNLDPQHATSYEIGVKGNRGGRFRYDVALFTMNVTGELVQFRIPSVEDRDFFRNAGRSRHRGIEVGVGFVPARRLRFDAAYTLSDLHILDDGADGALDGNRIPGVPKHHFFARAVTSLAGAELELQADYTSLVYATDANDARFTNPAHTVIDARLEWPKGLGRWGAVPFVALQNLLDEKYNSSVVLNAAQQRFYEPAPGRNVMFGLRIRYSNPEAPTVP